MEAYGAGGTDSGGAATEYNREGMAGIQRFLCESRIPYMGRDLWESDGAVFFFRGGMDALSGSCPDTSSGGRGNDLRYV